VSGALQKRDESAVALVDKKQPLGFLPTPSFWLDRDVVRLARPLRAIGGISISAVITAVAVSGWVSAPWWVFVGFGFLVGILLEGQFERYIRRQAKSRRGLPPA
jgi:hypothetical protein